MSHHYIEQIVHIIWSTQNQQFQIPSTIRNKLYGYISTVIESKGGRLYLACGYIDHIHCLLTLPPTMSIATMVQFIKACSSKWIKNHEFINQLFTWEVGYTSISVQRDRVSSVCAYINDENKRHEKMTYREELCKLLKLQNIIYDEKYLLKSSHSKLLLHLIWATQNRDPWLEKSLQTSLYQLIKETICKNKCVVHAIGGIEDHVHLLVEISRITALSDLIQEIKASASHWLLAKGPTFQSFEWQTGYGAFSISVNAIEAIKFYINNQEEHHKKSTSIDEWNQIIKNKRLTFD